MKRLWVILALGLFAFLVIGADQRNLGSSKKVTKKVCRGYTIISANMGIDCNSDTIKLMKAGGFYERMQ